MLLIILQIVSCHMSMRRYKAKILLPAWVFISQRNGNLTPHLKILETAQNLMVQSLYHIVIRQRASLCPV